MQTSLIYLCSILYPRYYLCSVEVSLICAIICANKEVVKKHTTTKLILGNLQKILDFFFVCNVLTNFKPKCHFMQTVLNVQLMGRSVLVEIITIQKRRRKFDLNQLHFMYRNKCIILLRRIKIIIDFLLHFKF